MDMSPIVEKEERCWRKRVIYSGEGKAQGALGG
jgi:hypothetical protein